MIEVDGNWGDWLLWFKCLVLCGGGNEVRLCNCSNLVFFYGGKFCVGDLI